MDDEVPSAKENNIVINPVNEEISDPTQEEHPLDMTYIAEPPIFKMVRSTRNAGVFQVLSSGTSTIL